MELSYQQIQEYIPHRHPFLLIDRVLDMEPGKRVVALKQITGSEYFFPGHFPGSPVMPGVLIVEAMAQAGATLAIYSHPENKGALTYFAGIDKTRFKKPVTPGDSLRIEIDVLRAKARVWKMAGSAFVGDVLVCQAELTAVIENRK